MSRSARDGYGTSRQLTPIPLSRADADPRNVLHEDDPSILVAGSSLISRSSSLWKGQVSRDGKTVTGEIQHYARYLNAGVTNDFSRFEKRVRSKGVAKLASLGRGELICLRAQDFFEEAVSAFDEDTFYFLKDQVDLEALEKR